MALVLVLTCSAAGPAVSASVAAAPDTSTSRTLDRAEGIDTADRQAVVSAWRRQIHSGLGVATDWNGSVTECRAGRPSFAANKAIRDGVNFVRGLAGLSSVTFSKRLSAKAQAAALIMSANATVTHVVPPGSRCYSKAGADAASRSNLYLDSIQMPADRVVPGYMTDEGPGNALVGHRRWILNPAATTFGSGLTQTAQALMVLGPTSGRNPNPDWVSWPTQGWFPSDFEPKGRWSLSAGSNRADFSRAHVKVTRAGKRLKVRVHRFDRHSFGKPALTWEVKGPIKLGVYAVAVSRIRGAASAKHSYTVRVFDPQA